MFVRYPLICLTIVVYSLFGLYMSYNRLIVVIYLLIGLYLSYTRRKYEIVVSILGPNIHLISFVEIAAFLNDLQFVGVSVEHESVLSGFMLCFLCMWLCGASHPKQLARIL
jgi:hypothetical protein